MKKVGLVATAVALIVIASPASPQYRGSNPVLDSRFFVEAGMFIPTRDFSIRVDGTIPLVNDEIDVTREFKRGESDQIFAAELGWRITDRFAISGQYFGADNSASFTLDEDIEWGDIEFLQGSSISAGTSFDVNRLFFSWVFTSAPHHNFGTGLGVHQMEFRAFIEGNALLPGGATEFRREGVKIEGPLPNLGGWYDRALSENWTVGVRVDWLDASVEPYSGRIVNAAAGVTWTPYERFGATLNYNYFDLDVEVEDSGWTGGINIRYHGPYISLRAFW